MIMKIRYSICYVCENIIDCGMKKIALLSATFLLLAGCEKPDHTKDLLNKVCDDLRGRYVCESIIFKGEPIDINGDGIVNTNLVEEFKTLNYARAMMETSQRIFPASDYEQEMFFDLEIPMQAVDFDKRTNEYRTGISGSGMFISFSYKVDNSGAVTYMAHNERDSELWEDWTEEVSNIDNKFTHGESIVRFLNGVLIALVNCAYYDYNTETFIQGQAEFTYGRVSYSLY